MWPLRPALFVAEALDQVEAAGISRSPEGDEYHACALAHHRPPIKDYRCHNSVTGSEHSETLDESLSLWCL